METAQQHWRIACPIDNKHAERAVRVVGALTSPAAATLVSASRRAPGKRPTRADAASSDHWVVAPIVDRCSRCNDFRATDFDNVSGHPTNFNWDTLVSRKVRALLLNKGDNRQLPCDVAARTLVTETDTDDSGYRQQVVLKVLLHRNELGNAVTGTVTRRMVFFAHSIRVSLALQGGSPPTECSCSRCDGRTPGQPPTWHCAARSNESGGLDAPASIADVDAFDARFRPWRTLAATYLYRSLTARPGAAALHQAGRRQP